MKKNRNISEVCKLLFMIMKEEKCMEEPIIREKELFKVCMMFPINRKSQEEIKEEKKGTVYLKSEWSRLSLYS